MKKFTLTTALLIFVLISVIAQSPHAFKYQAIIRDNAGEIMASQVVSLRMSIHDVSISGTIVYSEIHTVSTNQFGLVTIEIGNGTPDIGTISGIDWGSGNKYIETELDPSGGTTFVSIGTSQLMSVPFALYAENTANIDDADADPSNELNTSVVLNGTVLETTDANGTINTDLGSLVDDADADPANELQTLSIAGSNLTISDGNTVSLPSSTVTNKISDTDGDTYIDTEQSSDNDSIRFITGGTEKFRILPDGTLEADGTISANAFTGDGSGLTGITGDNLGNHTAVENIKLSGNWLSNDGGNEGVFVTDNGNAGIGTSTPEFKLTLDNDGGILAKGELNTGSTLLTAGTGTRMIWYPKKAAFRAGKVYADQWDDSNIGPGSVALGTDVKASAISSTAIGYSCQATGSSSVAIGEYNISSGDYSTTLGVACEATNSSATAIGSFAIANGLYSTAIGTENIAESSNSFVIGRYNVAGGDPNNWNIFDPLFEIGNGSSPTDRSNALTILKNGNTGINTSMPAYELEVNGSVMATSYFGDGSGLTNITGDNLGDHTATTDIQLNGNFITGDGGMNIDNAGENGVYIFNVGNPTDHLNSPYKNGFEVSGTEGNGLWVGRADEFGVRIYSAGDDGVNVFEAADDGYFVHLAGNPSTHYVNNYKNGFEVDGAQGNGLRVGHADNNGVDISHVGNDGVYLNQAGNPSNHFSSTFKNGFEVAGAEGNGLYVGRADMDGVIVRSAGDNLFQGGNDGSEVFTVSNSGVVSATSFVGDGSALTDIAGDNLGNHTASENIHLAGKWLSNDGDDEGISIDSHGVTIIETDNFIAKILGVNRTLNSNSNPLVEIKENGTNSVSALQFNNGNYYNIGIALDGRFSISNQNQNISTVGDPFAISPTGDVIIGGTLSGWKNFNVEGESVFSSDIYLRNEGITSGEYLVRLWGNNTQGVMDLYENNAITTRIYSGGDSYFNGGNLGIGTTNPTELLHVNGGKIKIGSGETFEDAGNYMIGINSHLVPTTDNLRDLGSSSLHWDDVYATNGTIQTSDLREKENIQKIRYGINEIMKLNPVSFKWKEKPQHGTKLGLIAQELLEVIPEVVKTEDWQENEETGQLEKVQVDRLGVYYSDLIPVLINAIQEQQEVINSLKTRIEQLENN